MKVTDNQIEAAVDAIRQSRLVPAEACEMQGIVYTTLARRARKLGWTIKKSRGRYTVERANGAGHVDN
jgi:hypothetical protein